jgi:hypothetical protein
VAVALVLLGALAALGVLLLAVLTGLGARQRGAGPLLAVVEAALFPLAWVAWYVRDVPAPGAARR